LVEQHAGESMWAVKCGQCGQVDMHRRWYSSEECFAADPLGHAERRQQTGQPLDPPVAAELRIRLTAHAQPVPSGGRRVSLATNLVGGDTNNARDVFVRDLAGKTTERVSVSSTGAQTAPVGRDSTGPSISGDGRYVAFQSEANNLVGDDPNFGVDVFIRDRTAATTERIGPFVSQVGMDISFIQGGSDPSINATAAM
jgi:hypothetical protein